MLLYNDSNNPIAYGGELHDYGDSDNISGIWSIPSPGNRSS